MARETRRSSAERFKYGICLNDECPKCKNKDVQQIPMRKEFVCEECGKELRECPPPKKSGKKPLIAAITVIALVGIVVGGIIAFSGGSGDEMVALSADSLTVDTAKVTEEAKADTVVKRDTVVVRDTIVQNNTVTTSEKVSTKTVVKTTSPATPSKSTSGSVNLGYAKFTGPVAGGKPNGTGRMTFTSSHMIDSRDPKGRVAEAGDYVIGEWSQGKLVQGKWFGSDNNVKGSIIIGL